MTKLLRSAAQICHGAAQTVFVFHSLISETDLAQDYDFVFRPAMTWKKRMPPNSLTDCRHSPSGRNFFNEEKNCTLDNDIAKFNEIKLFLST
jgi:hypothetical protein